MQDLEARLREVNPVGPSLGFDPDEVVTRAAKRTRRRVAVASTTATMVVALAAATLVFSPQARELILSAAPPGPTSSLPSVPPSGGPSTVPSLPPSTDISSDRDRGIRDHLVEALKKVMPGVRDVTTSGASNGHSLTIVVHYTDPGGKAGRFNLVVDDRTGAALQMPLDRQCTGDQRTVPDGRPLRCEKLTQPDGSVLVLADLGAVGDLGKGTVSKIAGLTGMVYREDGSVVGVLAFGNTTSSERDWLTDEQVTRLATDPAFTLK